jgi:CRP-like cAMP-binding protein
MDRAKTLTQLPGGAYGRNIADALRTVCREEGVLPGLYRGLPVAMVREASKNMFRIGLFTPILRALHDETEHDGRPAPAWKRFLAGTITGALGAVASNPFDLVKTRLQVPAKISEYSSMRQAMVSIYEKEGARTFYRGVGASVARDMLGSSVNLTVQSLVSEWFVSNHVLTPGSPVLGALSGVCSAAAAVAVMQPIDTSRAYVYLNPKLHKDALSAARFIVAKEGAWKLYKGSRAHFLRTAPHYGLMFAILEALTGGERDLTHRRNVDILRRVPIFDNLTDAQVGKLAHGVSVRTFKKGEMIVREGDDDDDRREMFFVLRGAATSFKGDFSNDDVSSSSSARANERAQRPPSVADLLLRVGYGVRSTFQAYVSGKKSLTRPGASAAVDEDAPCARGDVFASAEGDDVLGARSTASGRDAHPSILLPGDVFGEQALLVDEPRSASVAATSDRGAACLVVDRAAYESATAVAALRDGKSNAFHARTRAVQDVEMMWRRLRFQRELASVPLLAELSLYERSLLAKQCVRVHFAPGAKIMQQGDEADAFYILVRGSAVAVKREEDFEKASADVKARFSAEKRGKHTKRGKTRTGMPDSSESVDDEDSATPVGKTKTKASAKEKASYRVLRSYGPGAHFGELALLTNRPRVATVLAREHVTVLAMDKDALLALRAAVPTLEDHIVRGMRHYDHIEQFASMAMA